MSDHNMETVSRHGNSFEQFNAVVQTAVWSGVDEVGMESPHLHPRLFETYADSMH
jgi:hypothetical protein